MPCCAWSIGCKEKCIEERVNRKFLGLQTDNHLNWKNHIDQLIPKLSRACYTVRSVVHISNFTTLKSIHFTYFHSIIKHGIIFWGNLFNSGKIFTLQKKIVTIMVGAKPRTSCRSLFKKLEILPVSCQYITSLMNFTGNNQENLKTNSCVHSINTRIKHHLHRPTANLSCFQKKDILCWHKNFQQFTS